MYLFRLADIPPHSCVPGLVVLRVDHSTPSCDGNSCGFICDAHFTNLGSNKLCIQFSNKDLRWAVHGPEELFYIEDTGTVLGERRTCHMKGGG